MANNLFRLPLVEASIPAQSNKNEFYRHLLGTALKDDAPLQRVDTASLPMGSIRLYPAAQAKIQEIADENDWDFGVAFASLCAAGLRIKTSSFTAAAAPVVSMAMPIQAKSEAQELFYSRLMQALTKSRIVFAEGSTGIGKSRAMALAAIAMVQQGKTPVVISAPTVSVMEHLYAELEQTFQQMKVHDVRTTILPGMTEFVDEPALRAYLDELDDEERAANRAVIAWVEGGARALNPASPLAKAVGPDASWLMRDFQILAENMPVQDFALRAIDPDDECAPLATHHVQALRAFAHTNAQIVFCTHAMLAIGQKTQWRAMPAPHVLLLDEAHDFERTMAAVNSDQLSLYRFRTEVALFRRDIGAGKASIAAKLQTDILQLTQILRTLDGSGDRFQLNAATDELSEQVSNQALQACLSIQAKLKSRTLQGLPRIDSYKRSIAAAIAGLEGRSRDRVDASYSPDRRYPSLLTGSASVRIQLADIWNTASGGVGLVSATLYTVDEMGNAKCDYLRQVLSVPFERLDAPPPIVDPAIYSLPVLQVPSPAAAAELVPNGKAQSNPMWAAGMATLLTSVAATARGGTMVLMTSYKDMADIAAILAPALGERLVMQSASLRFTAAEDEYRKKYQDGLRPVLLALGTGWTGVDLRDKRASSPEEDFLLTDLVIARLPIGLNRSNTMLDRIDRLSMYPIIQEALLMFKQGLGRLIRQNGVTHRRLWIADGRIFNGQFRGMERLADSANRLLRQYKERATFSLHEG